ncbi:MAG: VCBS repeat-containing protein, partial [Bacteroidota bacterium]|nr:VCBS repeat-containing protein [Bacteroidota bacterium]
MKNKHFARKQRQLRYLVKQLNVLLKQTDTDLKAEISKMIAKIKHLVTQLNGIISSNRMKKILGTAALLIGISFSNTASAQHFAYPVTNPFGIIPGYTNGTQSVNLIDIDNDGDLDLFTDSLTYGYYNYIINFNFQENIGTATNPNFKVPDLNPFNLSLVANDSSFLKLRHFMDFDGDGDFDILSNVLYFDYYSFLSRYRYYENIGTSAIPDFTTAVINPFGLQGSPSIEFSSIGDIDNDGDFDLINFSYAYGSYLTSFNFIENTGNNTSPMFSSPQANTFGIPSSYGVVVPSLIDFDNDGDLDMIFAQESYSYTAGGEFSYNENTGTVSFAQFGSPVINPYGLNGSVFESIPTLEFKDLDGDSDLDILAGTYAETFYFENVWVPQPVTYECINYSCIDPGTGSGSYATLSACQASCIAPVSYECDWPG